MSHAIHVLIVDDESLIRWAVGQSLTSIGCLVVEAADARSATKAIDEASVPFDVVLLDYKLPDCRDLTLLATLRARSPDSRIAMLTAYVTEDVLAAAYELGALHVFSKPLALEEVNGWVTGSGPCWH